MRLMKPDSRALRISAVIAASVLLLAACRTTTFVAAPEDLPGPLPELLARAADTSQFEGLPPLEPGIGSFDAESGCRVQFESYSRVPLEDADAMVVLAHGFLRDLSRMRGWAQHFANFGVPTAVVSFCDSSIFAGRHDRNAVVMQQVAEIVAGPDYPVIYAGFSAGGLSAMLAAATDPRAAGYLGLDPVDSSDLAASIDVLPVPSLLLYGEPDRCNAQNNMLEAAPFAQRRLDLQIPFAGHCDFENPYDPDCTRLCATAEDPEVAAEARRTILALATAWISVLGRSDPEPALIFTSSNLDRLRLLRRVRAPLAADAQSTDSTGTAGDGR